MGKRPLTPKEVQERLPAHLKLVEETYVNTKQKALFIDTEYGEFWCRFNDIHNGHGHRARGYASPKRTKPPPSKAAPARIISGALPPHLTLDETTYTNKKTKARFIDSEYGEFWSIPSDVLKGHGHRQRALDRIRLDIEDVKSRLPPHMKLDDATFRNINEKARFIDITYGEFWKKPILLIHGKGLGHPARTRAERSRKSEHTCMQRYGVKFPMQDPDIALKSAEKSNDIQKIPHWDGSGDCACKGSWEVAVVNYLNLNKIQFKWQIPFRLSNGSIYICDLYLSDQDKYVEIKGWFRKDALKKWAEFRTMRPNSELWDKKVLKSMRIIT